MSYLSGVPNDQLESGGLSQLSADIPNTLLPCKILKNPAFGMVDSPFKCFGISLADSPNAVDKKS